MEQNSEKKQEKGLLKQLRDFGIGPILGMCISFISVPITTRALNPEEYGKTSLFSLFQTIVLIAGLLGLDQSFVRFYNQKDIKKNQLALYCLFLPFTLSVVMAFLAVVFKERISFWMFGSNENLIMVLIAIYIPFLILNRFSFLAIRMELKGKTYSLLQLFSQVLNFILLMFFLVFYEKTFRSLVISGIIAGISSTILCLFFVDKEFFKFKKVSFDKNIFGEVLKFGLPCIPLAVISWLLNSFDKVGLRQWSSFEQLGLYSGAFKIVTLLTVFESIFSTTWIPVAYKWYENKAENEAFDKVQKLVLAVSAVCFCGIIVFRDVLFMFLGPDYRNTTKIFVFLLFVPVMNVIVYTTQMGIGISKKSYLTVIVSIIAAVLNVTGNYFLIPQMGAEGAALTTCFSFIVYFWGMTLFSRHLWFKFGLKKYFLEILLLIFFSVSIYFDIPKILEVLEFLIILIFNFFIVRKYLMDFIRQKRG